MSAPTDQPAANKLLTLGAKFAIRETIVTLGAAAQQVCDPDPLRVYLAFSINSGGLTGFSTQPQSFGGQGYWLNSQAGIVEFWFARHGAMCQLAWYASQLGGAGTVTVFEIDYNEGW
jgi:hypothetical protein